MQPLCLAESALVKIKKSLLRPIDTEMSFSSEESVFPSASASPVKASLCLRAGERLLAVDLVVLSGDGVEGLVSVDHRAKHHRLQGREK